MKKEKNYARRYAKDFNILTFLYQRYSIYCLFVPIASIFYNIKLTGCENLEKKQYLYAANHISYFDPFLVALAVRGAKIAFMAKKELYESSYLAKNISRLGAFAVNREKLEVSTIKSAKEAFKAGWGLCIFPEGGIRKGKKIEAVNKGFVVLAKMANVDILPISIDGLETYNWRLFKRVEVNVKIGKSIPHTLETEDIIKNWREQVAEMSCYELCADTEPEKAQATQLP
ncbi:1-acyl-sn-glycerol-3-phosphate acyltransferase [Candidatus Gastranaerophilus sp. (ex Termes propinquus)]|nr:1-acyl-sn-glycerol-3-phosphate acyltransferase [Candidatus Gastranaerophilus sp. (ex Termes propinquus)]